MLSTTRQMLNVCLMILSLSNWMQEWKHNCRVSIKPEEVSLPFVPITTLQGIWGKAENLLSGHNSISSAPGNSSAYIVMSESLKKPHYVQVMKNGRIVCDEHCPMWRGRRFCSHTIAIAEKVGILNKFVDWLRKSPSQCNLTKLVSNPKEKRSAGTKRGHPNRKGTARQASVSSIRNRIADVTNQQNPNPSIIAVTTSSSDVSINN